MVLTLVVILSDNGLVPQACSSRTVRYLTLFWNNPQYIRLVEKKENKKIMEDTSNNMYNADQGQIASIV